MKPTKIYQYLTLETRSAGIQFYVYPDRLKTPILKCRH